MNKNRKDIFKRNELSEVVPLLTPYKINIDVANACNFKCSFCFHAIDDKELKKSGFKPGIMDFDLFKIIISQIKMFRDKIKCIGLTGLGEPLLNKRLPDMVKHVKESRVADKIVITSNGSLLTPEYSQSLIEAGLDELIVSIEGLSDEKYYDVAMVKISFQDLVDNIHFFNKNKGNCKIFIKIVDIALDESNDEKRFHEIFDSISDMAYVEKIIPQFKPVNYDALNAGYQQTIYGKELLPIEICSMIFYAMQIATGGNVCPCCVDYNETVVLGNVKTDSLYNIWNSNRFNEFRKMHLNRKRCDIELCHDCDYFIYNIRDEDMLDEAAETILDKMGKS